MPNRKYKNMPAIITEMINSLVLVVHAVINETF